MTGKIIKGIAGFYYVHIIERGVYECRAKGIFRKDHVKPLVGDNVEIDILDEQEKTGNLIKDPAKKEHFDKTGGGEYRPGAGYFCSQWSKTESESFGSVSGDDALAECGYDHLL